jgi:hypothetical protein
MPPFWPRPAFLVRLAGGVGHVAREAVAYPPERPVLGRPGAPFERHGDVDAEDRNEHRQEQTDDRSPPT